MVLPTEQKKNTSVSSPERFYLHEKKDSIPPVDPELKVVYVVPIKGEVGTGNFFYLLKDLIRQSAAKKDYEVIFVVNNLQYESGGEFFVQNQLILDIIAFINDQQQALPKLPKWGEAIVLAAKAQNVKIVALDHSSNAAVEKNISRVRTFGDNLAVDRLEQAQIKGEGAIVLMDADTRIGRDSTQSIIEELVTQPDIGMLKINYDQIPGEGGRGIFLTTAQERFRRSLFYLGNFGRPGSAGWYVIKAAELGTRDPDKVTIFDQDQQKSSRKTLPGSKQIRFLNQDRARRSVGGMFGEQRATGLEHIVERKKDPQHVSHPLFLLLEKVYERNAHAQPLNPSPELILAAFKKILPNILHPKIEQHIKQRGSLFFENDYQKMRVRIDSKDYGKALLEVFSVLLEDAPSEMAQLQESVTENIRQEKLRHAIATNQAKLFMRRVYTHFQSDPQLNETEITSLLTENATETYMHTFLETQDWIIPEILDALHRTTSLLDFMNLLASRFPDFLLPFDETEFGESTATASGVAKFLDQVKKNTQEFPKLTQLLYL
jgi:hypothetical protein